jgi:hypothetical protein
VLSDPDPGGLQLTKCLVCDEVTQPLDVSRWRLAGPEEIKQCIASIEEDMRRLQQARDILTGERRWANIE